MEVALFIMALVFLIISFSTAIMALEHELVDFADARHILAWHMEKEMYTQNC